MVAGGMLVRLEGGRTTAVAPTDVRVSANIADACSRTDIAQTFVWTGATSTATYVFPLHSSCAVVACRIQLNGVAFSRNNL